MKSDQKLLKQMYNKAFWSQLQDNLSINEKISKEIRGEFTVSLKYGVNRTNNISNECFIRKISGSREKIVMLIKNE